MTFISSDTKQANPYNDKNLTLTNSVVKLEKVDEGNDYTGFKKSESQIVIKPSLHASKYLNSVFDQATISSVSNLVDKGSAHESLIQDNSYQKQRDLLRLKSIKQGLYNLK